MLKKHIYDLIGIGLGPFNLSLAALAEPIQDIDAIFLEKNTDFSWHPGLLFDHANVQVPFIADLVTLIDPTNKLSFLQYLHEKERLYKFYFREHFNISRLEYNHYCQWVCQQLKNLHFNQCVNHVDYDGEVFQIQTNDEKIYHAKHIALGIGTEPYIPLDLKIGNDPYIQHAANYADFSKKLHDIKSICVVGSGQSAAEVILALLNEYDRYPRALFWITRSRGFFPMEYSKLGLEHFSPEYMQYFYQLNQKTREELISAQDLLYKGISFKTIADIFDKLYQLTIHQKHQPLTLIAHSTLKNIQKNVNGQFELDFEQWQMQKHYQISSSAVILATGYKPREPDFLHPIRDQLLRDDKNQYFYLNEDFSIRTKSMIQNKIFVQNNSLYTHGIGSPDLGLISYRNGVILNTILGKNHYSIYPRNVFQSFGIH
jgi:lysine N6-hydroxylase